MKFGLYTHIILCYILVAKGKSLENQDTKQEV